MIRGKPNYLDIFYKNDCDLEPSEGEINFANYFTRASTDHLPVDDLNYAIFTRENIDLVRDKLAEEIEKRTGIQITPEAQDRRAINKSLFRQYAKYERSCLYFIKDRPLEDHIAVINNLTIADLAGKVITELRELETYTKWRDNLEVRAVQIWGLNTKQKKADTKDLHAIGFYGGHERKQKVPYEVGIRTPPIVDPKSKYRY